jgi:hypothetical protein
MKLTDPAKDAILEVMQRQGLDPEQWYLEFRLLENGAIGLGFTRSSAEQVLEFGDLKLTIDEVIDTKGVMVDYGEMEGKKGLYFGPETACGSGGCGSGGCGGDCQCDGNCGEDCKCN